LKKRNYVLQYEYDAVTGEWHHRRRPPLIRHLEDIRLGGEEGVRVPSVDDLQGHGHVTLQVRTRGGTQTHKITSTSIDMVMQ
jgi:hypothetical protein